jgi:hypothetical protein
MDFDEILFRHYATGGHPKLVLFSTFGNNSMVGVLTSVMGVALASLNTGL